MSKVAHSANSIDQDSTFDFYSDTNSENHLNSTKNLIAVELSEEDETDENHSFSEERSNFEMKSKVLDSFNTHHLGIEKDTVTKYPTKVRNISSMTVASNVMSANSTSILSSNSFIDSSYNLTANTTNNSVQKDHMHNGTNFQATSFFNSNSSTGHSRTSSVHRQPSTHSTSTTNSSVVNKKRWSTLSFMSDHSATSKKRYPSSINNNSTNATNNIGTSNSNISSISATYNASNNTTTNNNNNNISLPKSNSSGLLLLNNGSVSTKSSIHSLNNNTHQRTNSTVSSTDSHSRSKRFSTSSLQSLQSLKSATSLKNLFSSSNSQPSVEETYSDVILTTTENSKKDSAARIGLKNLHLDEKYSNQPMNQIGQQQQQIIKHQYQVNPNFDTNSPALSQGNLKKDQRSKLSHKKSYSILSRKTSNISLKSSSNIANNNDTHDTNNKTLSHSRSYNVPHFQQELNSHRKLNQSPSLTSLSSISSGRSWKFWKRKSTASLYDAAKNSNTALGNQLNNNSENIPENINTGYDTSNTSSYSMKPNHPKFSSNTTTTNYPNNNSNVSLNSGNTSSLSNTSNQSFQGSNVFNNDSSSVHSSTKTKRSFGDFKKSLFSEGGNVYGDDIVSTISSGGGSLKTRSSVPSLRNKQSAISLRQKSSQTSLKKSAAPTGNSAISYPIPDQTSRDKIRMKMALSNDLSHDDLVGEGASIKNNILGLETTLVPAVPGQINNTGSPLKNASSIHETNKEIQTMTDIKENQTHGDNNHITVENSLNYTQQLRNNVVPDYDNINYKRLSKSISMSNMHERVAVSDYHELFDLVDEVSRTLPPHILKTSEILYERGNTRVLLEKSSNKTYKLIAFDSTDHIFVPLLIKHLKVSAHLSTSEWACPILKSWLISTNIPQQNNSRRFSHMSNSGGNSASCLLILEMENRGRSLSQVLVEKPNVAPRTLSRIFSKLITILADWEINYNLDHRDLSLDNILIDSNNRVTVIDYKLSKVVLNNKKTGYPVVLTTRLDHPLFFVRSPHYEVYSELRQIEPYINSNTIGWTHIIWMKYILHSMIKSCKIKDKHFEVMKEWLHFIIKHQGEVLSCKELSRYRKSK